MKGTTFVKIFCLIIWAIFYACKGSEQKSLERSFHLAGNNKQELKRVLDYYKEPKDSLKFRAAEFLIKHMWCHSSIDVNSIEGHDALFGPLERLYISSNQHTYEQFKRVYDSVSFVQKSFVRVNSDCQIVSANFLIQNIDLAFEVWQHAPWAKQVTFDDFCEYILPYHLQQEPIENCRAGLYNRFFPFDSQENKVTDPKQAYSAIHLYTIARVNNEFEAIYPFPMSTGDVLISEMGSCIQTNNFRIMVFRATGIASSMDFVPHWGNFYGHHEKMRLISQKNNRLITNENIPDYVGDIFDAVNLVKESECQTPFDSIPEWLTIYYNKRLPKVYRYMWSEQKEISQLIESATVTEMYPGWNVRYRKDVTDEYLTNTNVEVTIDSDKLKHKIAYLCVFEKSNWVPVAMTGIDKNGTALFPKLGRNIVFLPMVYEENRLVASSNPFYITLDGQVQSIIPDKQQVETVTLHSKFPLFINIANRALKMQGGVFQGANKPDFSDSVTIYRIKGCPFYINSVRITSSKIFRYYRFLPAFQNNCSVAELAFFTLNGKDTIKINGTPIASEKAQPSDLKKVYDNNYLTFYENASGLNAWIGLDLGSHNDKKVVKIVFCPRNDANGIIPNNRYELFYFNHTWQSLGVQEASRNTLNYSNVPVGALLWLKCTSEGNEERIFTYKENKQVWW
jgi:hypothetical protein